MWISSDPSWFRDHRPPAIKIYCRRAVLTHWRKNVLYCTFQPLTAMENPGWPSFTSNWTFFIWTLTTSAWITVLSVTMFTFPGHWFLQYVQLKCSGPAHICTSRVRRQASQNGSARSSSFKHWTWPVFLTACYNTHLCADHMFLEFIWIICLDLINLFTLQYQYNRSCITWLESFLQAKITCTYSGPISICLSSSIP